MKIVEPSPVNAIGYILVGGASSRFGRDKAFVELNGITMIERMKSLFVEACIPEVYLVGEPTRYSALGVPCVPDRWPGEGPLGGILTALLDARTRDRTRIGCVGFPVQAKAKWVLIVSCDMPFLTGEWMRELFLRSMRNNAQVVVPRSAGGLEPMCACWRTSARRVIEAQFNRGTRKIGDVFKHLKTEVLDEPVWKRFDTENRLFWNMNTPADYEEARRILEAPER
jgi:molybdopterin-guanine dinucleotide biosynthesis protein A